MSYQAKLDSFDLEIIGGDGNGVHDTWEKNVDQPDIVFAAGAYPKSMGLKERTISFRAVFRKENYEAHEFFVAHVSGNLTHSFVHPIYGPLKIQVRSVSVVNESIKRRAFVDINAVETIDESDIPAFSPDVKHQIEQDIILAQKQQMTQFAADMKTDLGPAAQTVLSKVLDPTRSLLAQYGKVSWAIHKYLSKINVVKTTFEGLLTEITNPADSIISAIDYGTSLPGVIISCIAKTVERYAVAAKQVKNSPLAFVRSFQTSIQQLRKSAGELDTTVLACAVQIQALYVADLYVADESNRTELAKTESSRIWNADGTMNYQTSLPQVLSVSDLELSLQYTCESIQASIDALRAAQASEVLVYTLKKMSANLENYIDRVKLQREKIIEVEIDTEMPVHAICLKYGLPYMAAERICSINKFWNPSFCSGKVRIYGK